MNTNPVNISDECEVGLEWFGRKELAEEGMQQPLVERVIDLASIDALREEGH